MITSKTASFWAALIVTSLAAPHAFAQCAEPERVTLNHGDVETEPSSFEAMVKQVERRMGLQVGISCNDRLLYAERTPILTPLSDPDFPKQLTLAYEQIILRMQAKQILSLHGRMTEQRLSEMMQDDSSNAREWPAFKSQIEADPGDASKVDRIVSKSLDLVEGRLDQELTKLGAPAEQVRRSSVSEKKVLFRDNLRKETLRKAVGEMKGLVPVATHIFTSSRGGKETVHLGVVAIVSGKTRQLADDIARQRAPTFKGTPNSLSAVTPKEEKEFLNEIGLRFLYDSEGSPMLLSYGRWTVTARSDNPARYEQYVQHAKEQAVNFAQSYVAQFANSSLMIEDKSIAGQISETVAERITRLENKTVTGSEEANREIAEIIDQQMKKRKSVSSVKMRGMSERKTWEYVDPRTNNLHVGAVIVWSPQSLANQNKIADEATGAKGRDRSPSPGRQLQENRHSRPVNAPDDF